MKQKKDKMKKIVLLVLITTVITACSKEKSMDPGMAGHWVSEDFYNYIQEKKDLHKYSNEIIEFIIPESDTNYTHINFNGKVKTGPLFLFDNKHLVIKNYIKNYKNLDVVLNGEKLEFINGETNEKLSFVKLNKTDFNPKTVETYGTYCSPYVNNLYIVGKYLLNSDTIEFTESGRVKNLSKYVSYSLCLDKSCRMSANYNTVFISNDRNEGYYFEYKTTTDSLIIYSIDEASFDRGNNAVSNGIKFSMKKIN